MTTAVERGYRAERRYGLLCCVFALARVPLACSDHSAGLPDAVGDAGSEDGGDSDGQVWLDDPLQPFPSNLGSVGLFADAAGLRVGYPRAVSYLPAYPLWSNEETKARFVVLPEGARVQAGGSALAEGAWKFPVGTVFFKTFFDPDRPERALETRLLRRAAEGWDYAVYSRAAASSLKQARLLTLAEPTPVPARSAGTDFEHSIPSETECRTCHEAGASPVLGFSELQLGADAAQWRALRRSLLADAPLDPELLPAADALTEEVLGYVHGNCVHCHNSHPRAPAVDLSYQNFVAATVGVPTSGRQVPPGLRVDPGRPQTSLLYSMLLGSLEPVMPSLGVQIPNRTASELVRRWIESLPVRVDAPEPRETPNLTSGLATSRAGVGHAGEQH